MIGRLAQLVEHLPYKEGVISSNLVSPTNHRFSGIEAVIVIMKWAISSVGRASPLQGGGHQFESGIAHHFIKIISGGITYLWCGSLAQSVEQLTFNQLVAGSNPARPTTPKDIQSSSPIDGSLAQSVEQLTFNQLVAGSNPARPTISKDAIRIVFLQSGC